MKMPSDSSYSDYLAQIDREVMAQVQREDADDERRRLIKAGRLVETPEDEGEDE